jgi:hypothetical protein
LDSLCCGWASVHDLVGPHPREQRSCWLVAQQAFQLCASFVNVSLFNDLQSIVARNRSDVMIGEAVECI